MSSPFPSRAHIAFAVVLLRSKPPGFSIDDYLANVRSAIVHRKRSEPANAQRHIDGTRFWRSAFDRSEHDADQLKDRIHELEQEVDKLRCTTGNSERPTKRKFEAESKTKANIQMKRRKAGLGETGPGARQSHGLHLQPAGRGMKGRLSSPDDVSMLTEQNQLLRGYLNLRMSLNKKSERSVLCEMISAAAHIALRSIASVYTPSRDNHRPPFRMARYKEFQNVMENYWTVILEAVCTVNNDGSDIQLSYIPDIVHLFQGLMGQIQQCCLDEAKKETKSNKSKVAASKTTAASQDQCQGHSNVWHAACKSLAMVLCHMFQSLDLNERSQRPIFGGMLCSLLDHIGSLTSLLVFAEPGSLVKKQNGLLPPRGLSDVAHLDGETAILTSQLVAPHLIPVLQVSISMINAQSQNGGDDSPNTEASDTVSITTLDSKFKEKLQNTFLRGVFGDEDTTFTNTLRRSAELDEARIKRLLESCYKHEDKSKWFISQVWEHIGWDVLTQKC